MSEVRVTVERPSDYDTDELADLSSALRNELLELDVDAVEPVVDAAPPEGAKGLPAWAATLLVRPRLVLSAIEGMAGPVQGAWPFAGEGPPAGYGGVTTRARLTEGIALTW